MKPPRFYRKFNYRTSLLPNSYLASLEDGVGSIEEGISRSGYTIGYPGWGVLYYLLLSHLSPFFENIIVETGTNVGCTTIVLAQALKDSGVKGRVFTVELEKGNFDKAVDNFKRANLDSLITAINCDSRLALKEIIAQYDAIRIVLLDASHTYQDVLEEFELVYPHLDGNALVIFDNTFQIAEPHEDQRVNGALKHIMGTYGGNLVNLEYVSWYTPGLAIWQKTPL
jgi:predicted O-methyltransferase YrrM